MNLSRYSLYHILCCAVLSTTTSTHSNRIIATASESTRRGQHNTQARRVVREGATDETSRWVIGKKKEKRKIIQPLPAIHTRLYNVTSYAPSVLGVTPSLLLYHPSGFIRSFVLLFLLYGSASSSSVTSRFSGKARVLILHDLFIISLILYSVPLLHMLFCFLY